MSYVKPLPIVTVTGELERLLICSILEAGPPELPLRESAALLADGDRYGGRFFRCEPLTLRGVPHTLV